MHRSYSATSFCIHSGMVFDFGILFGIWHFNWQPELRAKRNAAENALTTASPVFEATRPRHDDVAAKRSVADYSFRQVADICAAVLLPALAVAAR